MALEDIRNTINANPSMGKSVGKYAALGFLIAIPLPIVGPVIGALAGGAFGYFRAKSKETV